MDHELNIRKRRRIQSLRSTTSSQPLYSQDLDANVEEQRNFSDMQKLSEDCQRSNWFFGLDAEEGIWDGVRSAGCVRHPMIHFHHKRERKKHRKGRKKEERIPLQIEVSFQRLELSRGKALQQERCWDDLRAVIAGFFWKETALVYCVLWSSVLDA